ncbi:RIMS-binding protein 2 isoform X9 [Austrofundulus limnaeus]|uniref:RIMS-binding protein 2 n=1 Tax=Austrofundulus limnaeus TaxID=52670 RepID=A0A2I4DBV0_AUSLI|nr:PREDICTED: RIMS-binding protein 2-like isoform X9 [Austrofundulus limnaeus]
MREAAERRQQLELEHEQALAVLTAKQQEIDLLQKAQVEAKKEHEGAVHLLENHLDSMQAKVRELEEKCRSQSEQFNLLSKELEKFRLQAGKFDILSCEPLTVSESPGSPNKSLSQLLNGLAAPTEKGTEVPTSRSLISEFIRPLQISGDKPELLSVKPTFLSRCRASSPARAFLSEMDKELSSTTRSKPRFTGKVRLCVARYSYNPYDGPNEHPEAELPLVAGKYLYIYGTMDDDGFYEGELLDGQRGLVPSNFVDFIDDEEKPSVQHRDTVAKEPGYLNHSSLGPQRHLASAGTRVGLSSLLPDSKLDCLSTSSLGVDFLGSCSNGTGTLNVNIDEVGEDIVPYPRRITLIKQLAKSVIIGWDPPVVPPGWGSISGYNVLVDKEVRMSVPYGGRTKSLIEKLNLITNTYRISVQSITDRGPSDELRCTLLVGKDVVVAPYYLRVDSITQCSAELSWMPSNSNYSHTIFLNGAEYDMVKAGGYKYKFLNLKPMTVYKVKVVAQPHQVPWQLPMDQREKGEISVEFCTQSAGPPLPPQEVQVQCGQTPGVLQVRWKPPPLTPSGTSNGASVIGYAVCTKGQKVEKRNFFSERGNALHSINSDEEEDGYDSPHARRRGASVDEFLRGSELGRQHYHHHYSHSEDYHTESSRGSDLSDIMEEDEEDLYSEMQLEEGRRRSINSHSTLKIIGNSPSHGSHDHLDHSGRRLVHIGTPPQRRPIPSIEITMDSNSEGSEGNLSPVKEDVYYGSVAGRRIWRSLSSEDQYDGYGGHRHRRGRRSPDYFEESEPEDLTRVFVALFDYDPLSMSPNPDAADEELPFKEGQIIKVFGNKDTDGFYRAEIRGRVGLIPCNMVSEIQTEDDEMMGQLLKQGFLPLNTPVEKLVNCDRFKDGRSINRRSRKSKRERNRRSGRQYPMSTRRMVALYDYDPRESSPNVDVEYEGNRLNEETELTFCAGDVIMVFGEIDEDGFYYGELNGHKGLVPSNFLEEVPDDVEVFLTDSPSRYPQDTPARIKTKRVPLEKSSLHRRAPSPTVRPHIPGSGPATTGPGSPFRAPMEMYSSQKKKGLLSKGKKLFQRLGAVN